MKFIKNILIISIILFIFCAKNVRTEKYAEYAYSLIEEQCKFGARVPGTKAHEKCIEFLVEELSKYVDTVYTENFGKEVSYSDTKIIFTNIIGKINNNKDRQTIMLCAHYDSRPFSNEVNTPTPGANDGASGVGVIIALAKYINENAIDKNIFIVFFDGEDGGRTEYENEWFIGSKYFAENYNEKIPDYTILIDMIGDSDLKIYKEGNSEIFNRKLNNRIFEIARQLKIESFNNEIKYFVEDDHTPLNAKGFEAIDIIDMNYEYWHTPYDTPDKCSSKSLRDVFDVLRFFIYEG